MKKRAFTLVELLAVVLVLAIILIIAIPKIVETIESARKGSFISSAKLVAESAEREYTVAQTLGKNLSEFESGINCMDVKWAGLEIKDYNACNVKIINGRAVVDLVGRGKFEKYSVCSGTKLNATISESCNYSVTFNPNEGSVNPTTKDVGYGKKYGELPEPIRTGYTFLGWYTELEDGTEITEDSIKMNNEVETLYAHWKLNTFTVTFDSNGGSININSKTVTYEEEYGELPTPTRDGYIFLGWYTDITDGTEVTESTIVTTMSDHILHAHWVGNSYTLTYNANSGSVSPASKTIIYGSAYGELATPTRSSYTFIGWYTAASGGTEVDMDTMCDAKSNKTIYAHWAQTTMTYSYTGGIQTFTAPVNGTYKLEVWGAQGGNSNNPGGYGGYSVGNIQLTANSVLYIGVGGQGASGTYPAGGYNGGGQGRSANKAGGGGGATHIATATGTLSSLSSNKSSIIIVAGGGGGALNTLSDIGSGGGYNGVSASGSSGGTQSSAGTNGSYASGSSFGVGSHYTNNNMALGGGGGGYYGGGACWDKVGSGGSGYIGNSSLTNKVMYCYNCTASSAAATKTVSTSCADSTATVNCAKKSNDYAKITLVDYTQPGKVSLNVNLAGGTSSQSFAPKYKPNTIINLTNPTKQYCTFNGWSISGTGAALNNNTLTIGTSTTSLTANWTCQYTAAFTYTGNFRVEQGTNVATTANTFISIEPNWQVGFLSNGTLSITTLTGTVDIFAVGGGGGGRGACGYYYTSDSCYNMVSTGGGGGGTTTCSNVSALGSNSLTIGAGGDIYGCNNGMGKDGGSTSFGSLCTASGGSGTCIDCTSRNGVAAFGETGNTIYGKAGPSGSGSGGNGISAAANTGNGGGGAHGDTKSRDGSCHNGGYGGSGIILMRNHR